MYALVVKSVFPKRLLGCEWTDCVCLSLCVSLSVSLSVSVSISLYLCRNDTLGYAVDFKI